MTGLAAFTYLSLHFLVYLALFAAFSLQQILVDLTERAYITAGFAAWLVLLALAATSTRGWQRRLRRNWLRLHRLVYVAIPLGLLHLLWLTKAGYVEALAYGLVYAVLMLERWPGRWRRSPVP
jgi:sulfoxide reductase heme-binding subunit YedZ